MGAFHVQNIKQFVVLFTFYDVSLFVCRPILLPRTWTDAYVTVSNAHNIKVLRTAMKILPVLRSIHIVLYHECETTEMQHYMNVR